MAIFEAVRNASRGIKWSGFSSAYSARLLQILKATSFNDLENIVQYIDGGGFPIYTQVYKAGSPGFPFFGAALATNAALVVGKNFVSALAYGFSDFKVGFDNKGLKVEGSISALQAALGPKVGSGSMEDPVEWWTFYNINLETSKLVEIANQYVEDFDKSGEFVATAKAVKSLKAVSRELFSGDDQILLTNERDKFLSYQGNDVIKAFKGRDLIAPGLGSDTVDCGDDSDQDEVTLVDARSTPENVADYLSRSGVDKILRFRSEDRIKDRIEDRIVVSKKTLGLGADVGEAEPGLIFYDNFVGSQLDTPKIRFRYNSATGGLRFDPDGSGGAAPVLFASLFTDGRETTPAEFSPTKPLPLFVSV